MKFPFPALSLLTLSLFAGAVAHADPCDNFWVPGSNVIEDFGLYSFSASENANVWLTDMEVGAVRPECIGSDQTQPGWLYFVEFNYNGVKYSAALRSWDFSGAERTSLELQIKNRVSLAGLSEPDMPRSRYVPVDVDFFAGVFAPKYATGTPAAGSSSVSLLSVTTSNAIRDYLLQNAETTEPEGASNGCDGGTAIYGQSPLIRETTTCNTPTGEVEAYDFDVIAPGGTTYFEMMVLDPRTATDPEVKQGWALLANSGNGQWALHSSPRMIQASNDLSALILPQIAGTSTLTSAQLHAQISAIRARAEAMLKPSNLTRIVLQLPAGQDPESSEVHPGQCIEIHAITTNTFGTAMVSPEQIPISLSASGVDATFFSDAACSRPTSASVITPQVPTAVFYVKPAAQGQMMISAAGLVSAGPLAPGALSLTPLN